MILLDTDTLSIAQHPESRESLVLQRRLLAVPPDEVIAASIVSYDEQTRGWLGYFAKSRTGEAQLKAYDKLLKHLAYWRRVPVVPFDPEALSQYERLRAMKLRVGSNDLRIAATALSRNVLLLSRNIRDFKNIPGLRVEDWTLV